MRDLLSNENCGGALGAGNGTAVIRVACQHSMTMAGYFLARNDLLQCDLRHARESSVPRIHPLREASLCTPAACTLLRRSIPGRRPTWPICQILDPRGRM